MDLLKMSEKVENGEYRCWDGFFADVKWIVHDTEAYVHPRKSSFFAQSTANRCFEFDLKFQFCVFSESECFVRSKVADGFYTQRIAQCSPVPRVLCQCQ